MITSKSGFTLIEVLIALVILSIGLTALLQSTGRAIHTTESIENRLAAHFVSMNILTEIALDLITLEHNGSKQGETTFFGKQWQWQARAKKTALEDVEAISVRARAIPKGSFSSPLYWTRTINDD